MKIFKLAALLVVCFLTGCVNENRMPGDSESNITAASTDGKAASPNNAGESESNDRSETEDNYDGKIVRVYHGLPTNAINVKQEGYINEYLETAGCDFRIKLVGNDTDLGYDEYLKQAKADGETVDIEYGFLMNYEIKKEFIERAEAGEYYSMNDLLETETGKKLLAGLSLYMAPDNGEEKAKDYLEQYRLKDGNIYGIPMYVNFSAPYFIVYDNGILTKYGVETLEGDISDIEKILDKSDEMLQDGINPISIRRMLDNTDKLFGSLYGYKPYEVFWLLKQSEDGQIEAVNVFESNDLISWYLKLGEYRQNEVLCLSIDELKGLEGGKLVTEAEDVNRKSAGVLIPGAEDCIGYFRSTGQELGYDVLNVETYFNNRTLLCINNKTRYPEECFEFIEMMIYDTDFRRLMNLGPEGVGYKVVEKDGKTEISKYSGMVGIPLGLGLGEDFLIYDIFDNENYHMYQEKIYEGNSYAVRNIIGLADEFDLTPVKNEFEACNSIFTRYTPVFWGAYGDKTEEELDKLYKKLTDAGYRKVLEEMNRQLKGEK